ncbi:hypothetical protein Hypma_008537 [Hypsizygus marmoreus]|uniref:Uncharacterized protein n=1 Tax=Hypsizygus marmoreus TaxID=39966 RepID=A0A369JQC1_HYPMA|nr:hypothetical protein Hypma_008537 [Hypsizygus marmoreus]
MLEPKNAAGDPYTVSRSHPETPISPLDVDLPSVHRGSASAAFPKGKAAANSTSSINISLLPTPPAPLLLVGPM